jgi:energy-coupling factor transport system ATP-binding protein
MATAADLTVRYGSATLALRGVDFTAAGAGVTALMGRNGAGKSTLLGVLAGLTKPVSGRVRVGGLDPVKARPAELVRRVGLVPQDPSDLLYAGSVAEECGAADLDFAVAAGTCAGILDDLAPEIDFRQHPRDLSEGQRMCLALAVVLAGAPPLLLLDEPTRGLDYGAKQRLAGQLRALAAAGHGIVLSTHDVELVADLADRVVVLADGEVVADGPSAEVVTGSPMFAPQVAKILAPVPLLTVAQVAAAVA